MPKDRKKYLQRPKDVEHQHVFIRNVPKGLIRLMKKKCQESRPPITMQWAWIALADRWIEGVNLSSEQAGRPPKIQPIARDVEQSF